MITFAILLLVSLTILSFFLGSPPPNMHSRDISLPADLSANTEFRENMHRETRNRLLATLIFGILMLFLFFIAAYFGDEESSSFLSGTTILIIVAVIVALLVIFAIVNTLRN